MQYELMSVQPGFLLFWGQWGACSSTVEPGLVGFLLFWGQCGVESRLAVPERSGWDGVYGLTMGWMWDWPEPCAAR